jgi:hypothetical protein
LLYKCDWKVSARIWKEFSIKFKTDGKVPQKLIQKVKSKKLLWRVGYKIRKTPYFFHCLVENVFGWYVENCP